MFALSVSLAYILCSITRCCVCDYAGQEGSDPHCVKEIRLNISYSKTEAKQTSLCDT